MDVFSKEIIIKEYGLKTVEIKYARVLPPFLPKSRDLFGVYFLRRLIEKEAKLIMVAENVFAIC